MASPVFLDANAIIYVLDATSEFYDQTVALFQKLLGDDTELCTSHHVLEEVIYVASKSTGGKTTPTEVVDEIAKIPGLILIEPAAKIDFVVRYADLYQSHKLGVNDALLLQLMLDGGLTQLFSYDKQFVAKAAKLGITSII